MRKRYQAATGRQERGELLDELVEVGGYSRKHAISLMNKAPPQRPVRRAQRPGRPRSYRLCLPAVETVWEVLDYCCAERLHPQLLPLAEWLAEHKEIQLTLEVRRELAAISRATLARRLSEMNRPKPRLLRSGQHPSRLLKSQVPVARYRWDEERPGALEVDLVDHSGGRYGHHAYTLSVVDVVSAWSRRRAVMGKSQAVVHEALQALLSEWPSEVWALHSDNGSEFLGSHLIEYCRHQGIEYHRSRPYKKNDNAHVEQKNRQLVREIVGYERIDNQPGLDWLNSVYEMLDPYANLILPNLKVIHKSRVGSKIRKRFDTAKTPYERLLEKNAILPNKATELANQKRNLNPLELRRTLDLLQSQDPNQPRLAEAAD
jgi:transposase InsO family protein